MPLVTIRVAAEKCGCKVQWIRDQQKAGRLSFDRSERYCRVNVDDVKQALLDYKERQLRKQENQHSNDDIEELKKEKLRQEIANLKQKNEKERREIEQNAIREYDETLNEMMNMLKKELSAYPDTDAITQAIDAVKNNLNNRC